MKFALNILCKTTAALLAATLGVQGSSADTSTPKAETVRRIYIEFFKPIPKSDVAPKPDTPIVKLGRALFFDRALSPDRTRSCNDCHDLSRYGTNGDFAIKARDEGKLRRDVPSVYNLGTLKLMGWAGVGTDLRGYTATALTSASESAMPDRDSVVKRLKSIPRYRPLFASAFNDDAITFNRVVDALTAFQRGLVTRAPFDDFLLGNDKALSAAQLRGAVLFDRRNCSACHTGTAIGGQMLQKAGIVRPWPNQKDLGHFEVSKNPAHKMAFRVPPLRNVAKTAPYFHDHSSRSLRRAIRDITLREQGMYLDFDELRLIELFLDSLTGRLPTDYIKPPATASPPTSTSQSTD